MIEHDVPDARELDALLESVAQNRDRTAFKTLFDHFAPRLKGFVMRQGSDPHFAEEVVQETMVNVWRKARQFDSARASAATWIYTIARNMRIDLLRKINRPEPDMDDPALVPDPAPAAPENISKAQEAARLRAILSELPDEQQEVLRLAFFEEKPHGDVAAELGIPLGTVKSRIRLAVKRIRTEFGEDE
jgi:RNA polymerase sigma factor (sigma-70 family)